LLARWIDEVVIPNKWSVMTAEQMGRKLRRGPAPAVVSAPEVAVSKAIPLETWSSVAKAIANADTLPREFEGDLNLTEAFYGLVILLASDEPPNSITLGRLNGPYEIAPTGLHQPHPLTPSEVRATAGKIAQRLGGHIPALITIGTATLTAAEALQVMARVYLDEEAVATPVTDPDPFAPGGGWGASSGL
jgi:hypothetical protein